MGDVVVSLDAELSWGYHDLPDAPDRLEYARQGWKAALSALDTYRIPATWAIVGHLFHRECDGVHADHPLGETWFSCTAGTADSADEWRAPDLIDALRESETGHEIAAHTYSHVPMKAPYVTDEIADAEFEGCLRAAAEHDLSLETLVFPRNQVAHRDRLAASGFQCYRGVRPRRWYEETPLRPAAKLVDWSSIGTAPDLVHPSVDEYGLVNVPASLYLYSFQGPARTAAACVGSDPVLAAAKRGVRKAATNDGVFHVWLHPHNLRSPGGETRFSRLLAYIDDVRARTDLRVRTMRDVARSVR